MLRYSTGACLDRCTVTSFLPFKQRTFSEGNFIPGLGMVFGFVYSLPFLVDSCNRWVMQSTGNVDSSVEQRWTPTRGLSRWTRYYYEIEGQSSWTSNADMMKAIHEGESYTVWYGKYCKQILKVEREHT